MSTKVSVEYNNADNNTDFHLYLECMEAGAIYLQLGKPQWEFDGERVTVRIPQEVFKKIATEKNFKTLERHSESLEEWLNEEWKPNLLFCEKTKEQGLDSGQQEGEPESGSEE